MKTDTIALKKAFSLLAIWLTVVSAQGQVTAPVAPDAPKKPIEEEILVLSPFVVNSDADVGYRGSSTLAGTRLDTKIKDLGASISVYSKELLKDLGATNMNELLIFTPGAEAGGTQGNYSGESPNQGTSLFSFADTVRSNPQSGSRVRGLSSPNYTRGFFRSNIPIDSYNVKAVTVNRGPNAILFGVASPAGLVDTTLLLADLRKSSYEVEFRYGNNDSTRSSVDLNQVIIPKKLALRVALLNDDEKYNQEPAFAEQQRIYGALMAKPFRSTSLRASFESGHGNANRPLSSLPINGVSDYWYAAGMPTWDWTYYDDPARNPAAASQNASTINRGPLQNLFVNGQFSSQIGVIYNQPTDTVPQKAMFGQLVHTTGTTLNQVRANLYHPISNRDSTSDGTILLVSTAGISEVGANYYSTTPGLIGLYPDGYRPPGLKYQGYTDYSVFDFKNHMLDETGRQTNSFHTFNIAFDQLAWKDRLGIELVYNSERFDRTAKNPFMGWSTNGLIRIDLTAVHPDGTLNPNVGRPFISLQDTAANALKTEAESVRATAFARYDFKDISPSLGKWLGRHSLTGVAQEDTFDSINYEVRLHSYGELANTISDNFSRRVFGIVYIGDSILGGAPLKLQPVRVPVPNGVSVQTTYFAAPQGSTAQGDWKTTTTSFGEAITTGAGSREVIKSRAAVLQSHWLDAHLITTLGWRRDEDYYQRQNISLNLDPTATVPTSFDEYAFASTPPPLAAKEIKSYSAVLVWPQKLVRLPWHSDFRVFVNGSENFTPVGGRTNAYLESLPSPVGKTKEFGVDMSFLDERIVLRLNWFETNVQGQSQGSTPLARAWNNVALQMTAHWAEERNYNPTIDRAADIELMFGALPSNYRELYNWTVSGSAANATLKGSYNLPSTITDTTDFTAKGTEAELTFNPNRQWRLIVNVANQETIQSNMAPVTKEFLDRLKPVWDKLANVPEVNYPTGHVMGNALPAGWPTLGAYIRTIVDPAMAQLLATEGMASAEQRKWRANLVVNYTFANASRLKGFNIGTAVRWQDKLGIGYPASYKLVNNAYVVQFDIANPIYIPAETNVDMFAGYTRKIWKDRVGWKIQLNVRNAIGQSEPIGVLAQPTGEVSQARLPPERRWYLTNTFSF